MTLGYFPGCSGASTGREFAESTEALMEELGVSLVEIPDWNCCGSTSAAVLDPQLTVKLNARNLIQAAALQADILVPCAACYNKLKTSQMKLAQDPALAEELGVPPSILQRRIMNLPETLLEIPGLEVLRERTQVDLSFLRPGAYYGCLLLRPPQVMQFDDPEQPTSMERILEAVGVEPVTWYKRTECCGASLSITTPRAVENRVERIVDSAKQGEANCLVAACPLCVVNLESRQLSDPPLPVYYLSEIVGAAVGISPDKLGTKRHLLTSHLRGAEAH
jgi:heterodisulfide reductase subunit B